MALASSNLAVRISEWGGGNHLLPLGRLAAPCRPSSQPAGSLLLLAASTAGHQPAAHPEKVPTGGSSLQSPVVFQPWPLVTAPRSVRQHALRSQDDTKAECYPVPRTCFSCESPTTSFHELRPQGSPETRAFRCRLGVTLKLVGFSQGIGVPASSHVDIMKKLTIPLTFV